MMAGEHLGVGHEPRHGTSYVASWVKALKNDPREIRLAVVDVQKACDWLCDRERTMEREPTSERPSASPDLLPPQPRGRSHWPPGRGAVGLVCVTRATNRGPIVVEHGVQDR